MLERRPDHRRQPVPRQPAGRPARGRSRRSSGSSASTPSRRAPADLPRARPHRVRARRHPQPADRQGDRQARVDTVVHAALMATPRAVGGRVAMQEMNVIGTMQLLAACQKSDTVERVVLRSTTAVYGSRPGDPAVFTEDMHPRDGRAGRLREGRRRGRGLRARLRPAPARRRRQRPAAGQPHRPDDRHRADPLPAHAGRADRRSASTRACSCCTRTTPSRCCAWPPSPTRPGVVNVAGDGVVLARRRSLRGPGGSGSRCRRPALGAGRRASCATAACVDVAAEEAALPATTAGSSTPPGCAPRSATSPRYTTADALDSYLRRRAAVPRSACAGVGVAVATCCRRARVSVPGAPAPVVTPAADVEGRRAWTTRGSSRCTATRPAAPARAAASPAAAAGPRRARPRRGVGPRSTRRARAAGLGPSRRRPPPAAGSSGVADGAGLPAPPARAATTRSTSSASTPTSPSTSCCPRSGRCTSSGSASRSTASRTSRPTAARCSSPTTPAGCGRWTRR